MTGIYKNIDEYNAILEKPKILNLFDDNPSTRCNRSIYKRLKIKHLHCFHYAVNQSLPADIVRLKSIH